MNFFGNLNLFMNNGLNFTPFSSYSFNNFSFFNFPSFNFNGFSNYWGTGNFNNNISIFNNFSNPAFNNCWNSFSFGDTFTFGFSQHGSFALSDTNQSSKSSVGGSTKETALTIYQKCRKNADKRGLTLEFFEKLVKVCNNIQCDPMDMLAKMWASSRWKTYAVNDKSGAVGLTQIKPKILEKYGVKAEDYQKMSAIEQLDIIEKYFLNNKKKCNMEGKYLKGEDLFAMNFLSSRANQQVLVKSRNDRYYDRNRDKDNDGDIDKDDMRAVLNSKKIEMLA